MMLPFWKLQYLVASILLVTTANSLLLCWVVSKGSNLCARRNSGFGGDLALPKPPLPGNGSPGLCPEFSWELLRLRAHQTGLSKNQLANGNRVGAQRGRAEEPTEEGLDVTCGVLVVPHGITLGRRGKR